MTQIGFNDEKYAQEKQGSGLKTTGLGIIIPTLACPF